MVMEKNKTLIDLKKYTELLEENKVLRNDCRRYKKEIEQLKKIAFPEPDEFDDIFSEIEEYNLMQND
jgi:hypothetical protein